MTEKETRNNLAGTLSQHITIRLNAFALQMVGVKLYQDFKDRRRDEGKEGRNEKGR